MLFDCNTFNFKHRTRQGTRTFLQNENLIAAPYFSQRLHEQVTSLVTIVDSATAYMLDPMASSPLL